jgi:transaldolase/glucose-6-phosphate isomerase
LTADLDAARSDLAEAERLGLDLAGVTRELTQDGVAKFAEAFDALLSAVASKRTRILGERLNAQSIHLPAELQSAVDGALARAANAGWTRRLWRGDATLWTNDGEAGWMGWLAAGGGDAVDLSALDALTAQVKAAGYSHVLLLGMGGSSLGPEVIGGVLGSAPGFPTLLVLDSTDPDQIARIEALIDPAKTLFIVSSKSGSTLEPDILHRYFYAVAEQALGVGKAGAHFVAVTDPGSKLESAAVKDGFAHVFMGVPSIGGRYSVLSHFGLVPAAAMGLDIRSMTATAAVMARGCGASAPPAVNPGFILGAVMGEAAKAGRDKVTLITSDGLAEIGAWLEQLIAESTGKQGRGLIPVAAEPLAEAGEYGQDRLFAYLRLARQDDADRDALTRDLEEAGHPVIRITLANAGQLTQEFFRWEVATAVAGALIGINPFNQPDVESSKIKTRALTDALEAGEKTAPEAPLFESEGLAVYAEGADAKCLTSAVGTPSLDAFVAAHFARSGPGDYLGILAYLDRNEAHTEALTALRACLLKRRRLATVLGFGPRFLHSTGQAYKGGPDTGVFLEITATPDSDIAIPGRKLTFGEVEAAQARGDLSVLAERGRRLMRIDLGDDIEGGLKRLAKAVDQALA